MIRIPLLKLFLTWFSDFELIYFHFVWALNFDDFANSKFRFFFHFSTWLSTHIWDKYYVIMSTEKPIFLKPVNRSVKYPVKQVLQTLTKRTNGPTPWHCILHNKVVACQLNPLSVYKWCSFSVWLMTIIFLFFAVVLSKRQFFLYIINKHFLFKNHFHILKVIKSKNSRHILHVQLGNV